MGRPRKYDWDDKRDVCYRLWTQEKLSAPQIVKWFANHFNLPESELPGPNQFHHKFRQWHFPPRRETRTEEEEARLVARTRELFAQNLAAGVIQKTLADEGWELDNYHFRVFRKKYGLLLRSQNGYKSLPANKKRTRQESEVEDAAADGSGDGAGGNNEASPAVEPAPLPPEEVERRAQRLAELQIQSDELLRTRKRRRRIRGYGHLPADEPGLAPRYGSETSLDECKVYLQLSNDMYVQVRNEYEAICREMGIVKMSLCAEGQWQASKDRLTRNNMHLSSMLHPLQPELDKRLNALNCICSDVTKRMRNFAKALTIPDASNILGLNPVQSKTLRRGFYEILQADHFTTTSACGPEHVAELREKWYATSDLLQQAIASGDQQKMRAIDLLCKDARKRYADDESRKDPSRRQRQHQKHYGPGPGPAKGGLTAKKEKPTNTTLFDTQTSPNLARPATRRHPVMVGPGWFGREHELPEFHTTTIADMVPPINFDLDPLLSETTHGPPWPPQAPQSSTAIPAYFRLAPESQVVSNHPRMWLGRLSQGASFDSLRHAATSKAHAARLVKVTGAVKNQDGSEDRWLIENDEELGVYLEEAGEKATFTVVLEDGLN